VWEQYRGEWLRTSVSAYHYAASQLITFQSLVSDTLQARFGFVNDGLILANGVELEAEIRTKRGLQALMSYVRQDTRQSGTDTLLVNSPAYMVKARVAVPLGPRAFASAEWQLMDRRATIAGDTVAAASVVHLTAGWPITNAFGLTGSIANLFDQRYADPASDEHLPDSIPQNGRTMRVGLRWTIRAR
jgi:iron complex outermembrane receptor protein